MRGTADQTWRVLGRVSLPFDGHDLCDVLGAKQVALLAMLLVADRPVARDDLAGCLWPTSDRQAARHNLRQALLALRRALGDRADSLIRADNSAVSFIRGAVPVDLHRLRDVAAHPAESLDAGEILALCRGPVLEDFTGTTPALDAWLEGGRVDAARLAIGVIDRASPGATSEQATALAAARVRFAAALPAEPAGTAAVRPAPQPAPRARHPRPWRGPILALIIGLGLGTAVMLAGFTFSPGVRTWMLAELLGRRADVPSIAVRPFRSLKEIPVEANLAGGVTVGVTYGLYTVTAKDLFVVTAPATASDFAGISALEYATELGVRYLISGTVEYDAGRVRVFVRCFDAEVGHDIWQDRFTSPVGEAFEIQDDITLRILQGLEIDLSSAERNRIQYLDDTDNLEAWLLAVKGVSNLIKLAPGNLDEAYEAYRLALQIDPEYISARRGVAWHALLNVRFGRANDPTASIQEARNHINVIVRRAPEDGMSKALEGLLLILENDWEAAIAAGEDAVRLLPGSADVWAVLAHSYTFTGQHEKALEAIDKAMSLSPGHPKFYEWIKARALRQAGEVEAAIEILDQVVPPEEETLVRLVELAAAFAAAGRLEDAQRVAPQIIEQDPDFRASRWVLHPAMKDPEKQSLEFELLSKAGL